jgi:hypothetical protein
MELFLHKAPLVAKMTDRGTRAEADSSDSTARKG